MASEKTRWQIIKESIASFFKNYAVFEGRASRDEFAYPWVMMILGNRLISAFGPNNPDKLTSEDFTVLALQLVVSAAVLLPTLSVMSRRLHDTGRSAKNLWFFALPIVGWILLLVWCLSKGDEAANKYGAPATTA